MKKIALFALLSTLVQCHLQDVPGTLDPTFGGNGTGLNLIDLGSSEKFICSAIDSQGRLVAVGTGGVDKNILIARFNTNGTLDTSFGGSGTGYNLIDVGGGCLFSLVIDPQGRIVAGGIGNTTDVFIMRFNTNGTLDTSFGGSGGYNFFDFGGTADHFTSIMLDSQDRIVGSGTAGVNSDALIMRFTQDGLRDLSFGGNGTGYRLLSLSSSLDVLHSVLADESGSIIAVGSSNQGALVVKFTSNGVPDTSFGSSGHIIYNIGTNDVLHSVRFDLLGRIVAGGTVGGTPSKALFLRLMSDGSFDTSFNDGGYLLIDFEELQGDACINSIYFDDLGRIIGVGAIANPTASAVVIRCRVNGSLDTSFGEANGYTLVDFGGESDTFESVIKAGPHNFVAVGHGGTADADTAGTNAYIARFFERHTALAGTPDLAFGDNEDGFFKLILGDATSLSSLVVDEFQRIIGVGEAAQNSLFVMRLHSDGTLDTSFGGNGTGYNMIPLTIGHNKFESVKIDHEGKIVAVGFVSAPRRTIIMRFNNNGTLDTSFGESNGYTLHNVGGSSHAYHTAFDFTSDNKIVVCGERGGPEGNDAYIMKFNSNGILDQCFGETNGYTLFSLGASRDSFFDVRCDSQERIVVVGSARDVFDFGSLVVRFNSEGILDTSFGHEKGYTIIKTGGESTSEKLNSFVFDSKDRIIASGTGGMHKDAMVMRLTSRGIIDIYFGKECGYTLLDLGSANLDEIFSIVVDDKDRIVGSGRGGQGVDFSALIVRFLENGALDETFGGEGTGYKLFDFGSSIDTFYSLQKDVHNNVCVGGVGGPSGVGRFLLVGKIINSKE